MLRIEGVKKVFDDRVVLRGVSFSLQKGEITGLVGPSGGGKSVLLKIVGNIIKPDAGRLYYDSEEKYKVGFLFQEGALFDSMTVIDNVVFPLVENDNRKQLPDLSRKAVYERGFFALEEVGLARAYKKHVGQLSGGMRRRLGIARALVSEPDLVLLDDPTGGLDPVAASVIIDLIKKTAQKLSSPSLIFVSHDIRRLLPNVHRILGLFDGVIKCDCAPEQLLEQAPEEVIEFLATRYDFWAEKKRPTDKQIN